MCEGAELFIMVYLILKEEKQEDKAIVWERREVEVMLRKYLNESNRFMEKNVYNTVIGKRMKTANGIFE